jgi:hypothetical protein
LFFYSADRAEPPHIHVERDECGAKFCLDPVRFESSRGFHARNLGKLRLIIEESESLLVVAWHEYFGN